MTFRKDDPPIVVDEKRAETNGEFTGEESFKSTGTRWLFDVSTSRCSAGRRHQRDD